MRPDRFEDLIALVALYRPGPMANIPTYCARKHGRERSNTCIPKLQPILRADLRHHHLPGAGDADRPATGRLQPWPRPISCAAPWARRSRPRWRRSATGSSPAPSSAASTRRPPTPSSTPAPSSPTTASTSRTRRPTRFVAYQTAYMKANYPVEFLAASMTLDMGNTDKLAEFRSEAQRLGIKVAAAVGQPLRRRFRRRRQYHPLRARRAQGRRTGGGGDRSWRRAATGRSPISRDFARRINPRAVNKRVLESLAAAGAFDDVEPDRARAVRRHGCRARDRAAHLRRRRARPERAVRRPGRAGEAGAARRSRRGCRRSGCSANTTRSGSSCPGHPLDDYAGVLKQHAGAVLGGVLAPGEIRRDGGQGRRHRGVAGRAAHQDRQQDGHHRAVGPVRPLRGGDLRGRAAAVSRSPGARQPRCC